MNDLTISFKNKLSVVAGAFLGFIGILIGTSLVVTFPVLINEFHVSLSDIQWLSSGYYLVATIIMSTTAYLMKRIPLKRLFQISSLFFIIGSLIASVAHTITILLIGTLLDALATGIATPLMYQIVFHNIPSVKFGLYTGIVTMIKSFGPAFGPTYGGILTHLFSWRYIFICIIPLVIIVLLLGSYAINLNNTIKQAQKFDFLGFIIFSITLFLIDFAFSRAGKIGFINIRFWLYIIIGLIFLAIFVFHLKYAKGKYLNFKILKQNIVRSRAINFFNLQFVNLSLAFMLPLFAEEVLHLNSMDAGLLLLPGALIGALVSPLSGKFYDKKGAFITLSISNICLFFGVLLYLIFTYSLTGILICIIYILFRLGYTFGFGNILSDAGHYVDSHSRSDVSSLFNTLQQYAGSLGTNLMASIISIYELLISKKSYAVMFGSHIGLYLLIVILIINIIITGFHSKRS